MLPLQLVWLLLLLLPFFVFFSNHYGLTDSPARRDAEADLTEEAGVKRAEPD